MRRSFAPTTPAPRRIRDESYKQSCIERVETYLTTNNFPSLRPNSLTCPSSKEFQTIFKFIYSAIDKCEFLRFEDEVIATLKNLKYPFQNEINRSQLVAITPHTWPSVLSMLSWLVGVVEESSVESKTTVESLFFDFLCNGFLRYCLGEEEKGEEEFEKATRKLFEEEMEITEELKKETERLEEEMKKIKENANEIDELKDKKNALTKECDSIVAQKIKLIEKNKKHIYNTEKYAEELRASEVELEMLCEEEEKLKLKISKQEISPEDVKKMNAEKIILSKSLGEILPKKENLLKSLNETQALLSNLAEDAEKLLSDLKSIVDVQIDITDDYKIVGEIGSVEEFVTRLVDEKKEDLANTTEQYERLNECYSEQNRMLQEFDLKIKSLNDRFYRTGKHYIERKEAFDYEKTESQKEMEKLENELMKLKMVSNRSLISAQQNLQKAKIRSDRVQQAMDYENEEIEKIMALFISKMEEQIRAKENIIERIINYNAKKK